MELDPKPVAQFSTTFNAQDLIRGLELSKDLYGLTIKEQPCNSQEELIEKYQALKNFKNWMTNINQELGDAETSGTSSTEKQSKRQKKRNQKKLGENSQNLSLAEKKKLLEQ